MNATQLFHNDGRSAKVWYCTECRTVAKMEEAAEACCRPRVCKCGAECSPGWLNCSACREANIQEALAAQVKAAKKVPAAEWTGPVVPEGHEVGFATVGEALDYYQSSGEAVPFPIWGTHSVKLNLNAEQILEHATEEMYEGAMDGIPADGFANLQYVLDVWAKAYAPSGGWQEDNTIVVVLP